MNPAQAVTPTTLVRIARQNGEQKRRDPQADLFRRALQEHAEQEQGGERGAGQTGGPPAAPSRAAAPTPTARALQRQLPGSRRDRSTLARHVDVLA